MSNEHPYRPCPSCGGVEFDSFPDLAIELMSITNANSALPIPVKLGAGLNFSLIVCSGCGKTDVYTKNAAKLRERVKGASHFRAASPR